MNTTLPPIISPTDLLHLYNKEVILLFDVSNGKDAKKNYEEMHLKGALFVDLETQLAEIKDDCSNGRHPLPKLDKFLETVAELGISKESHVVIYDDKNGANAAARFWWMLKAIGIEKVQALDGGLQEAENEFFPLRSEVEIVKKAEPIQISDWLLPLVDMATVEKVSKDPDYLVIDVRDEARYQGLTEPIDKIAGHIPGAVNIPFSSNLDEIGLFKTPTELRKEFEWIFGNKKAENIIVHCGSGVTACHTLLAIAHAGLEIPNLYVGSWSEWSRNGKEMVTKNVGI